MRSFFVATRLQPFLSLTDSHRNAPTDDWSGSPTEELANIVEVSSSIFQHCSSLSCAGHGIDCPPGYIFHFFCSQMTDSHHDSPPSKTSNFLQRTFHGWSTRGRMLAGSTRGRMLADRHEEGCYENNTFKYTSLLAKGLPNDDVGVAKGAPYFRRYGRELVSKPAVSLKNRWGGYRSKTLRQKPDLEKMEISPRRVLR